MANGALVELSVQVTQGRLGLPVLRIGRAEDPGVDAEQEVVRRPSQNSDRQLRSRLLAGGLRLEGWQRVAGLLERDAGDGRQVHGAHRREPDQTRRWRLAVAEHPDELRAGFE